MRFSLKTLIWIVILVALLGAGMFAMFPEPVDVEIAIAKQGPLRVSVEEDGKTRIREKYTVSAPVSGRLSRIELKPGDVCKEQSLLAVLLPSTPSMLDARARAEATANVKAAEAALKRSQSSSAQAQITHDLRSSKYKRSDTLLAQKAISKDEWETVKSEYLVSAQAVKTANFDMDIARFELAMARAAVDQFAKAENEAVQPFEIHAPVSGKVIRVFEESSRVVAVGMPLLELGDPQNLEVEIDVLSTDAVRIKPGAKMTIEHWGGGTPLQGNVRVVEPGAFTKTSSLGVEEQRVNIIADFNEPAERIATLGDGYRVEARITIKEMSNVLAIPNSALFRHQREWHVMTIVDNHVVIRKVSIGLQNKSHAQILAGLEPEDPVIIYPSDDLKPGTLVRPSLKAR